MGNNEKRCPEKNFKWRENKVKFLGARLDLYWPNCHFNIELYRKGEQNELLGIPTINFNLKNSGYQMTIGLSDPGLHFITTNDKPKVYQWNQ